MTDELAKVLAMRYDRQSRTRLCLRTGALEQLFLIRIARCIADPSNGSFMALTKNQAVMNQDDENALGRGVGVIEGGRRLALQLLAADRLSHQERHDMKMAATDVLVGIGAGGLLTGAMEEAAWP